MGALGFCSGVLVCGDRGLLGRRTVCVYERKGWGVRGLWERRRRCGVVCRERYGDLELGGGKGKVTMEAGKGEEEGGNDKVTEQEVVEIPEVEDGSVMKVPLKVIGSVGLAAIVGGIVLFLGVSEKGISADRLSMFADWFQSKGAYGQVVYGLMYTALEIVALPALPLTVGCGFLFGPVKGTAIVSASSTLAAALSFLISRYALRDYISNLAKNNSKFRAVDRAVSKEGFKFTLLLRLSPIFPFALSNYLYGLTSLKFRPYILGSWLGMLPGTIAYVSGGAAAEELTSAAAGRGHPNFIVVGLGAVATVFTLYNLSKIASATIEEEELKGQSELD